ncbi:hypothetical protein C8R45DRAFT_933113 [Mycena sanguinolenta]|nr:hypothetical protein C8R45DRAFT_933113 [Mycena sanguinolenta]
MGPKGPARTLMENEKAWPNHKAEHYHSTPVVQIIQNGQILSKKLKFGWNFLFGMRVSQKGKPSDNINSETVMEDDVFKLGSLLSITRTFVLNLLINKVIDGCHETQDPGDYESDGDNNTDDDTESPVARKRVSCTTRPQPASRASRPERATVPTKRAANVKPKVEFKPVVNPRAASVPVKIRAASLIPVRPVKGAPASPVKKVPLYADMDDNDDVFCSDSSVKMPLAQSVVASRAVSVVSKLSALEDDEPMPAAPVAISPTVSHTISSESSLLATSAVPSQFLSVSTGIRRIPPPAPPRIPLALPFAAAFASAPAAADIPFPSAFDVGGRGLGRVVGQHALQQEDTCPLR